MKVSDLVNEIMVLTKQFTANGIESGDISDRYNATIPIYANKAQRELIDKTKFLKPYSYTVPASTQDGYSSFALPTDFLELHKIYDSDGNNRIYDDAFFYVSDALYVINTYNGTLKIEYKPYSAITSLDDTLLVPDNYSGALCSFIASNLILGDDDTLASLYMSEWNEAIANINRQKGKCIKRH